MEIPDKLKNVRKDKRVKAVILLGIVGMALIMISSLIPEKKQTKNTSQAVSGNMTDTQSYCSAAEKRLEEFLSNIDGAGDVRVYLTVGSTAKTIYATEGKRSKTDNKTEEEEKYVMVGGGSDKSALVENIEAPEIQGAVIICSGCDSPAVREQIYRAAAAALGLPTGKIYVGKLKGE